MRSHVTLRHRPFREVAAHTNEDRPPLQVLPFGQYGAGVWTGHPIGLFIVAGFVLIGLIGIPEWRWFFGATVLVGSVVGYMLWRRHG